MVRWCGVVREDKGRYDVAKQATRQSEKWCILVYYVIHKYSKRTCFLASFIRFVLPRLLN